VTSTSSRPALRLAAAAGVDLAAAIDAFLSQPDLAPTTRAKHRQTLAVEDQLGDAPVTGTGLAGVVEQRWHHASPATWNRHGATVRSFAHYCTRTRILEIDGDIDLQRRAEKHDHTRSIPLASLELLWERRDIDLRERTLWRLLYETAARADEVLRLDIEDLDIPAKRAPHALEGRRCRPAVLRLGQRAAAATPDRRPPRRSGVPIQPSPEPGPRAGRRRHLPADRPRATVIPPGRGAARRVDGLDAASVPSLRAHAPGRGQRAAAPPHGQEPAPQPAHPAALRAPGPRRGRRADAAHDPARRR
jgi:integrase